MCLSDKIPTFEIEIEIKKDKNVEPQWIKVRTTEINVYEIYKGLLTEKIFDLRVFICDNTRHS